MNMNTNYSLNITLWVPGEGAKVDLESIDRPSGRREEREIEEGSR